MEIIPRINLVYEVVVAVSIALKLGIGTQSEDGRVASLFFLMLALAYSGVSASWGVRVKTPGNEQCPCVYGLRAAQGATFLIAASWFCVDNFGPVCFGSGEIKLDWDCSVGGVIVVLGVVNSALYFIPLYSHPCRRQEASGSRSGYNIEFCIVPRTYQENVSSKAAGPPPYDHPPAYDTVVSNEEIMEEYIVMDKNPA